MAFRSTKGAVQVKTQSEVQVETHGALYTQQWQAPSKGADPAKLEMDMLIPFCTKAAHTSGALCCPARLRSEVHQQPTTIGTTALDTLSWSAWCKSCCADGGQVQCVREINVEPVQPAHDNCCGALFVPFYPPPHPPPPNRGPKTHILHPQSRPFVPLDMQQVRVTNSHTHLSCARRSALPRGP